MVQGAVVNKMDEDDVPELTPDQLDEMRPAREMMSPGAYRALKRGRPPVANPKRAVSLRLDPDVLDAYKATGKGWQTRINEVLRKAMPGPQGG